MHDVHWCVTVDYQQIVNSNIANEIHGFTINYGKCILKTIIGWGFCEIQNNEGRGKSVLDMIGSYDVIGADFENSLNAFGQSEKS